MNEEEKDREAVAQEAPEPEDARADDPGAAEDAAGATGAAEGGEAGREEGAEAPPAEDGEPDWKDMYARTLADFDNYRKRTVRDREELVKFAASAAIEDVIPVADNLALALERAENKDDPFVKGVGLAFDGLLKALKDHGAEPFDSLGEKLDPNLHEAIATMPSATVEEGRIANEVKKGWKLNGRLLRAAQVVVSSGKAE